MYLRVGTEVEERGRGHERPLIQYFLLMNKLDDDVVSMVYGV